MTSENNAAKLRKLLVCLHTHQILNLDDHVASVWMHVYASVCMWVYVCMYVLNHHVASAR